MRPQLTSAAIDSKLFEISTYVNNNVDKLASVSRCHTLSGILGGQSRQCADAKKFGNFLYQHESKFSLAQQERTKSLALLLKQQKQDQKQEHEQQEQLAQGQKQDLACRRRLGISA